MVLIKYSSTMLTHIGKAMTVNITRLPRSTFQIAKTLDILKPLRGTRAGVNKYWKIPTIVNVLPHDQQWTMNNIGERKSYTECQYEKQQGANSNNLNHIHCTIESPIDSTKALHSQIPAILSGRDLHGVTQGTNSASTRHRFLSQIKCSIESVSNKSNLSLTLLNARSVNNKSTEISEFIHDNNIDVLALTETWLKKGDDSVINDLCPEGYSFVGKPRSSKTAKRGGGLGFVHRDIFDIKTISSTTFNSFENMCLILKAKAKASLCIVLVYRPPPNKKNKLSVPQFMEEFERFLAELVVTHDNLYIIGDFNFHWGEDNNSASQFEDLLNSMNLKQNVTSSTHKSKHVLDLVITHCDDTILEHVSVADEALSDHFAVNCSLKVDVCVGITTKTKEMRKFRDIDRLAFAKDLNDKLSEATIGSSPSDILQVYNDSLNSILNVHAPCRSVKVKGTKPKPWYNDHIHEHRQIRRKLERKMKKTGLVIHKEMFKEKRRMVAKLIDQEKSKFFKEKLDVSNTKEIFGIVNKLLNSDTKSQLPPSEDPQQLVENFATYFSEKITSIRTLLDQEVVSEIDIDMPSNPNDLSDSSFSEFKEVTEDDIRKIIKGWPSKSCSLDPIPTWLLKDDVILKCLLPLITALINSSLKVGCIPDDMKQALVAPLLKKIGLLLELFKNYRPVSNLSFLSKVMEKTAAIQLTDHMDLHGLHDILMSAYRKGHSVETALIKIKNDIDLALDQGFGIILILLDLSAAFDTIDHWILLRRLATEVGLSGNVLKWFQSYLEGRSQKVVIEGKTSSSTPLSTGVPQGSVLGPLLFLIYILPLGKIIDKCGVCRHGYADDTQLYLKFSLKEPGALQNAITKMETCISEISKWMVTNKLKLNNDKTEFIVLAPPRQSKVISRLSPVIKVGSSVIEAVHSVKNLGAVFDDNLAMDKQVNQIRSSMFYHMRRIRKIRNHLDRNTCERIVQALVTSRLDFNNALLLGLPAKQVSRLQLAQNCAARLVTGCPRGEHITPFLKELHWLPVHQRIQFKALMLLHQAIHSDTSPVYMQEMAVIYIPRRVLRSANDPYCLDSYTAHNTYGTRTVQCLWATRWNSLPFELRATTKKHTFKKSLKTVLFKEHFDP